MRLEIDRGPSDVAIVRPQVRSRPGQADEAVDLTQQVIIGDMPRLKPPILRAEAITPS